MALDFTAIDFETANSYRGSPCSVGLVKVRGGLIVDQAFTLIHPPTEFEHFDGFNTWLHGINAEMVAGAPTWPQVVDWIVRYTRSDILVCHNAGFDIGVIRYACVADDLPGHRSTSCARWCLPAGPTVCRPTVCHSSRLSATWTSVNTTKPVMTPVARH